MIKTNVYISVTEGTRQLVVDGPLDLFQKFLTTIVEKRTAPEVPDLPLELITPPAKAISHTGVNHDR